jgi:anti-sigma factor ChrR (cupin superfamily)
MSERDHLELTALHALGALPEGEVRAVETHIAGCEECQQELAALRPIAESFVSWPTDVLRPPVPLWDRLSKRIAAETGQAPLVPAPPRPAEPEWEEAAPGIFCKLLATDTEKDRVSMLVRLLPGATYPSHRHAGVEELYLLDGELIVDEKLLFPGDYLRSEPGVVDTLVWSKTGCTCVLLTSTRDVLL